MKVAKSHNVSQICRHSCHRACFQRRFPDHRGTRASSASRLRSTSRSEGATGVSKRPPNEPADARETRCTTVTQTRQQDASNLVRPHRLGLNQALYTVPRFAIRNLFVRYQFVPQVTVTFNRFQELTHHFNPEEISSASSTHTHGSSMFALPVHSLSVSPNDSACRHVINSAMFAFTGWRSVQGDDGTAERTE